MQTVSHAVSHIHVANDGKTNSILNKVDDTNKQLNKKKLSYLDKLDNKVHPHMPIDYHHSTMLLAEVNKHHHLADATLLNKFYMSNTHYPNIQSHTKENSFKSTYSYDSISSPSEVNTLICLAEAASESNTQEATTQHNVQDAATQTDAADYPNDTDSFDSFLFSPKFPNIEF